MGFIDLHRSRGWKDYLCMCGCMWGCMCVLVYPLYTRDVNFQNFFIDYRLLHFGDYREDTIDNLKKKQNR